LVDKNQPGLRQFFAVPRASIESALLSSNINRLFPKPYAAKRPAKKGIRFMKRFVLLTGVLALAAPMALAQSSTWISDPAHSEVDFSITHLSISNVHGRFGNVAATIAYNEADVTKSTVSATIGVGTVDTGVEQRNTHLKSPDFFGVDTFPAATFNSTSVVKSGNKLTITGNLTLHGVTKPVVLEAEGPTGPVQGMDHKPHAGFSATTTLSRSAFGIGSKFPAAMVSDDVKLDIELEVVKQ
jgi:polyisoprenoid-binding protein YceI